MTTGKDLYEIYRWYVHQFKLDVPEWADLPVLERTDWESRAYEQDLRDRDVPARFSELEKGSKHALSKAV